MSKPQPSEPAEKTVTLTETELRELIADAAAGAGARAARGNLELEGATMAAEDRVSRIQGTIVPERRPWPTESAEARLELSGWAGPATFRVTIKVRDRDSSGNRIDPPVRSVTQISDVRFPSIPSMQAKHSRDDLATFDPGGKSRPDLLDPSDPRKLSIRFLQEIVSHIYEIPLRALFLGKDIRFLKPYLTSELMPVDLGEIRRDATGVYAGRAVPTEA